METLEPSSELAPQPWPFIFVNLNAGRRKKTPVLNGLQVRGVLMCSST